MSALEPVPPPLILARRQSRVILAWFGWHLACGALLAWPVSRVVSMAFAGHPDGDGPLFADGAYDLMSFLRDELLGGQSRSVAALEGHVAVLLPLFLVLGLVPMAAFLVCTAHRGAGGAALSPHQVAATSFAFLPRLLLLWVAAGLLQAMLCVPAILTLQSLRHHLGATWPEPNADAAAVAVAFLLLLLPAAVCVLHDLARAAAVRHDVGPITATRIAWRSLRRGAAAQLWGWSWRHALGLLLVAGAAAVSDRFGGRPGNALLVVFVAHQAAVLARVGLRASWLAAALRAVAGEDPSGPVSERLPASETPARSDAQAAPSPDPVA